MRRKSSKLIAMYLQAQSREAQGQVSQAFPYLKCKPEQNISDNQKLNQFLYMVDSDMHYVFKQIKFSKMEASQNILSKEFKNVSMQKPDYGLMNDNMEPSITELFHLLINSDDKILLYSQFQQMIVLEKDGFVLSNRSRFVYFHLELLREKTKIDKSQTLQWSLNEETIELIVSRLVKAKENIGEEIKKIKLMSALQRIKFNELLFKAREMASNKEEDACVKLYEQIFYDRKATEGDRTEALQYLREVSIKNRSSICLQSIMKHIKEQEGLAKHEEYVANAIREIKSHGQTIERI